MKALVLLALLTVQPLPEPAAEARARALEQEIRCLQCQGEPISQSTSDLAQAMRVKVRELIADGQSDSEVRRYFVDRYREEVLLRPRLKPETLLLWLSPLVLMAFGLWLMFARRAGVRGASPAEYAPEESER